jgi:signal transduction histidine kinase
MLGIVRARFREALRLVTHSLSGRLLVWTLGFVLLSEVLIFVPSVARFHQELLTSHIQSAELAILPFTEPGGDRLSDALRNQLLNRAGAAAVVLKRADQKQLFLVDGMPSAINVTIDLTGAMTTSAMFNAIDCLLNGGNRTLHVIAPTHIKGAQSIGIVLGEAPIRTALLAHAREAIFTSLFISVATAMLVFSTLYFIMVRPMARLTRSMVSFRQNPEDASRIIQASARPDEIGIAERELQGMQRDIFGFLQQKTRLAGLGSAVARIQHDLRNILANAQLASDRLSAIDDPLVQRLTPRLIASLDRAVSLATSTLRYGRAEERAPQRQLLALKPLIADIGDAGIASVPGTNGIAVANGIDSDIVIDADPEQLYRMVLNLVRNAAEALETRASGAEIRIAAMRNGPCVSVDVIDNGPGIPEEIRTNLFQPFATAARSGGSGLGLAIARELARSHGGDVMLVSTGAGGSCFRIAIPDREDA